MAMTLWNAIRAEATICQFTPELIHQDFFDFCGNQMLVTEMDMPYSLKSDLAKRQKRATEASRERSAEQLLNDLESVALVAEGSDLGTSEESFEPTASCINDIKKRQLVTRSGLSRLRWCMPSPPQAGDGASTSVSLQG